MSERPSPPRHFSDDPIESESEDLLARTQFARQVVQVLSRVQSEQSSSVLALMGPWGSGKSSVLSVVTKQLQAPKSPWTIVHFNPWEFSGVQTLAFAFFDEIAKVLYDFENQTAFETFQSYASKLLSFGGAVTDSPLMEWIGINPGKLAESAAKLMAPQRSVTELRARLETALRERARPTLVVLDDVDRLMPSELLMVFKLIRLLGRLPNICYLLAYDEATLLSVLQETELARGNAERALAYLEKIVQVRLDLPIVHQRQARTMIDESLRALAPPRMSAEATDRVKRLFDSQVLRRLTEPRSIKRFFAQLRSYLPLVTGEVDFADFIGATYLRTYHPLVVRGLYHLKEELFEHTYSATATPDAATFLVGHRLCEPRESVEVGRVLAHLFPQVIGLDTSIVERHAAATRRIASRECFDRYFYFGIPPEAFSDEKLRTHASNLGTPRNADAMAAIKEHLDADFDLTISRLLQHVDGLSSGNCARLLALVSARIQSMPPHRMKKGAQRYLLGASLLAKLDRESARTLLADLAPADDRDYLLYSAWHHHAQRATPGALASEQGQSTGLEEVINPALCAYAPQRLARLLAVPLEVADWSMGVLFCWSELGCREDVQRWLEENIATPPSAWTLPDLLAICVPADTSKQNRDNETSRLLLSSLREILPESLRSALDDIVTELTSTRAPGFLSENELFEVVPERIVWAAFSLKQL
ncbi:AAA family ATPase [Myxococcus sp. CA051A]|uniref:KAP family P-loop NTPase fold protein n=1 Tax=Myxococcus sp. CA051A TaxID=2741739 RepID=UPI00157A4059|nr:P-loop NTPase fold protein [Myxococcus sp. CA051A]NTX60019.1 AAA family ATPase [Myxococcus sp. CA051A]